MQAYLKDELQQLIQTQLPIDVLNRALGRDSLLADIIAGVHKHIKADTHAQWVNAATALLDQLFHLCAYDEFAVGHAALGPDHHQLCVQFSMRSVFAAVGDQISQIANDGRSIERMIKK